MKGGTYSYAIYFKRAPIMLNDPTDRAEKFNVMRTKTLECIQSLQTWIKSENITGVTFINGPNGDSENPFFTVFVKMSRATAKAVKKAPNVHSVTLSPYF